VISKIGDIDQIQVLQGDKLLANFAVEAVKQWKYRPDVLQGQPVEVDTQITVNFTLS
jgi:protein TonB